MRERLRRHPNYSAAVRRLAANMIADADRDPALATLLRDAGRTVTGLSAAHLGLSGRISLARLSDLMAGFGLTSRGRVRALLSHMLHLRYVSPDPAPPGARSSTYRLTDSFLASYREHERSLVEAAAVLEPKALLVLDHLDRTQVLAALVAEQTLGFAQTSQLPNPHAIWFAVFMHRHAGIQLLHLLVAGASKFPPTEASPVRLSDAARRFMVSRVHLSRMLANAQAERFVALEAGGVRFTQAGCEALHWIYAGRLCVHLRAIERTARALPDLIGGSAQRS